MPYTTLLDNIRTIKTVNLFSCRELSELTGINQKSIHAWFSAKGVNPQLNHMVILSRIFDVSIDDLCRRKINFSVFRKFTYIADSNKRYE